MPVCYVGSPVDNLQVFRLHTCALLTSHKFALQPCCFTVFRLLPLLHPVYPVLVASDFTSTVPEDAELTEEEWAEYVSYHSLAIRARRTCEAIFSKLITVGPLHDDDLVVS